MRISDRKKERIYSLIAEGEKLNPLNLFFFYRWVHAAYEELEFYPSVQERFDLYCRSSCDTNFMRVYLGLWLLKFSVRRDIAIGKDPQSAERLNATALVR